MTRHSRIPTLLTGSLLILSLVLFVNRPARCDAAEVPVGLAQMDVTPDTPIRMNGYG